MNRDQLEHVLRAASRIAEDPDIVVIGSQSILGSFPQESLPLDVTASVEVDVTFFDDFEDSKSDQVDGAIGELSPFHEKYGYYAQGVSITTAILPQGWRERIVLLESTSTAPGRGHCLDPHDCVISKLVAGREKDLVFAHSLIRARLIDPDVLLERLALLDGAHPLAVERMHRWIEAQRSARRSYEPERPLSGRDTGDARQHGGRQRC